MLSLAYVMAGGAIGAAARYLTGQAASALTGGSFPWGTLTVNIVGGLAMGLLAGSLSRLGNSSEAIRLFAGVGVLGGFTTFSAFSLEVVSLAERGAVLAAAGYILASVAGAVLAAAAGLMLARGGIAL